MAPTKKSIYRQPGAQHFQLVHRSVRDPLINDPEASQQVFKSVERYNAPGNQKTGTTMAELAQTETTKMRQNEGEAAGYGITFDDSAYDYMQHLKRVGEEGALDSVLLAAPRGSGVAQGMKNQGKKEKGKGKMRDAEDMFQLPESVLPSRYELTVADVHASQQAIPTELQGLQPDMDPHLRQVLEALDDDAFVEDDGAAEDAGDDVFGQLLGSGELEWDEDPEDFEFAEWGVNDDGTYAEPKGEFYSDDDEDSKTENGEPSETWEDRFRAFKAAGGKPAAPVSDGGWDSDKDREELGSEAADTVGSLSSQFKDMMVQGGKKRRGKRGPSDASGMSMSSASVFRSQGLRDLDDRFDRLEREYELDDDDEYIDDDDDDDVSIAPSYMSTMSRVSMFSTKSKFVPGSPPTVDREDFDAIMDDFLENYEVVGSRMRAAVGTTGLSGAEKLKVLRAALEDEEGVDGINHAENRRRILEIERLGRGHVTEAKDLMKMEEVQGDKEKWDVETILSTYTNTENHPGTIRLRSRAETQARAERRAAAAAERERAEAAAAAAQDDEDDSGSDTETETTARITVARPKGEASADKKARKTAVKAERASRRAEKKAHTVTFGDERKRQIATQAKAVSGGRAADVSVTRGVIRM